MDRVSTSFFNLSLQEKNSILNVLYFAGFRTRVKYIDLFDPSNTCYYISKILDAGLGRPLFMVSRIFYFFNLTAICQILETEENTVLSFFQVSLESRPSELFIRLSPVKCWDMVQERINHEISKQIKLGRLNLPLLQPLGSLDGMEMFGYSSPFILQVVFNVWFDSKSQMQRLDLFLSFIFFSIHSLI